MDAKDPHQMYGRRLPDYSGERTNHRGEALRRKLNTVELCRIHLTRCRFLATTATWRLAAALTLSSFTSYITPKYLTARCYPSSIRGWVRAARRGS